MVIIRRKWKGTRRITGVVSDRNRSVIEILYEDPKAAAQDTLVIICHPNPLAQGSMYHKIPTLVARTAHSLSLPSLRFQFSAIGLTSGPYESFEQQVQLLDSVIYYAQQENFTEILLAGFSFGGACILQNTAQAPKLAIAPAWKFLSTPLPPGPHITICHTLDDSVVLAQDSIERFPTLPSTTKTLILCDKGGHFFLTHLDTLKVQCVAFLNLYSQGSSLDLFRNYN